MKIERFTKLNNGMYKLKLEDDSLIKVHEEVILKNDLLLTKEISEEDVKNIDKLNNNYNAYDIAVKYISTKYRSCYEVFDYLEKKGYLCIVIPMKESLENTKYEILFIL